MGLVHLTALNLTLQFVETLLTHRTADDLTDLGEQHVGALHRRTRCHGTLIAHGTAIGSLLVLFHIERLESTRIVGHDNRLLEVLLDEVALVLRSEVVAPVAGELELLAVLHGLLQDIDTLGIGQTYEGLLQHTLQTLDERLVDHLVQELQIILTVVKGPLHAILDEVFFQVHQFLLVDESHLGLHHPELGQMAWGIGILSAERRTEGVDSTECRGSQFTLQLSAHRQ